MEVKKVGNKDRGGAKARDMRQREMMRRAASYQNAEKRGGRTQLMPKG